MVSDYGQLLLASVFGFGAETSTSCGKIAPNSALSQPPGCPFRITLMIGFVS